MMCDGRATIRALLLSDRAREGDGGEQRPLELQE